MFLWGCIYVFCFTGEKQRFVFLLFFLFILAFLIGSPSLFPLAFQLPESFFTESFGIFGGNTSSWSQILERIGFFSILISSSAVALKSRRGPVVFSTLNTSQPLSARLNKIYHTAKSFLGSTYGMMSLMVISEVTSIVAHDNIPGAIVWMALTIIALSIFQILEIKFFTSGSRDGMGYLDSFTYSIKGKFGQIIKLTYIVLLSISSFLSCIVFQTDQINNFFIHFRFSNSITPIFLPILLLGLLIFICRNNFQNLRFLSLNFLLIPLLSFILWTLGLVVFNSSISLQIFKVIINDVLTPHSIFTGIFAGIVTNLSRSLYVSRKSDNKDCLSLYHKAKEKNSRSLGLWEMLLMVSLTILGGITTLIIKESGAIFSVLNLVTPGFLAFFGLFILGIEFAYFTEVLKSFLKKGMKNFSLFILSALGIGLGVYHSIFSEYLDYISISLFLLNAFAFLYITVKSRFKNSSAHITKEEHNAQTKFIRAGFS